MADPDQVAQLKQGAVFWNAWRQTHADLPIDLTAAVLREANFTGAHLYRAKLQRADFRHAYLVETDLHEANLYQANLTGARLYRANLQEAHLQEAHLQRADLRMANLTGAYFTRADLYKADLDSANLRGANLRGVILQSANLQGAVLQEANLHEADLSEALLQASDLRGANLQGGNLTGANFQEANLQEINFTRATLSTTIFSNVDLSQATGLDTVQHRGPSSIDIDTLIRSRGKIPETFLRGCGVPDSWIEYLPSLISALQPIQYYSCFISYTSEDEPFAQRLHSRMRQENLRVWFAPHDLQGGYKLRDQIEQAIHIHDKVLLVLSNASIASNWVAHEIRRAYQKGRDQNRQVLFPIRLAPFESFKQWNLPDDDTGLDLAAEIRRYYVPDFSNWKNHDAFEATFAQLLAALRAETLNLKQQ